MISIAILFAVEVSNCRCSPIPIAAGRTGIENILRSYVRVCKLDAKPAERVIQRKAGFAAVRNSVRLLKQTESRFRGCSRLYCNGSMQKQLLSQMDNLLRWDLAILGRVIAKKTAGPAWDEACKSREASLEAVRGCWRRLRIRPVDVNQRSTVEEFLRLSI